MKQNSFKLQKRMRFLSKVSYNGAQWQKVDAFDGAFHEVAYIRDPKEEGDR
jgi:hypothetical protein